MYNFHMLCEFKLYSLKLFETNVQYYEQIFFVLPSDYSICMYTELWSRVLEISTRWKIYLLFFLYYKEGGCILFLKIIIDRQKNLEKLARKVTVSIIGGRLYIRRGHGQKKKS